MHRLRTFRHAVATWWSWWSPRQLRARVAKLESALGYLATEHNATLADHHAWIAALVDLQQGNPGRYRELRRIAAARLAALKAAPTTPTVSDDVPPAEEGA